MLGTPSDPRIPTTSLALLLDDADPLVPARGGQRRDRTKAKAQRAARRQNRSR